MNWAAVLGLALVAALGLLAYQVITGSRHAPAAPVAAGARLHQAGHRHHGHPAPSPAPAARTPSPAPAARTPAPNPYAHIVAIDLTATGDCWVEFTTPTGRYLTQLIVPGGTSRRWTFRKP